MPSVLSSRQAIGMISNLLNGVLFPKSALQYLLTKLWKRTPFLNQTKLFNSLSFWQHKAVAGWSWRVHCPWLYKTKEVVASSDQRVTRSYNLQSSSFSHVSLQESFVHAERWERKAPYLPAKPSRQGATFKLHRSHRKVSSVELGS